MNIDPFLRDLLPGFAVEVDEISQRLQGELVELERDIGEGERRKLYESLARGLHTLKGTSATLGLEHLAELAHQMENLLAPFRASLDRMPADLADSLLKGVDIFVLHAKAYAMGQEDGLPALPTLGGAHPPAASPAQNEAPPSASPPPAEPQEVTTAPQTVIDAKPAPQASAAPASPAAPPDATSQAAEAPAAPDMEFEGSWRVSTADVLGLMREVERLREIRLRLDDRRREVEQALAAVERSGQRIQTTEARANLESVMRGISEDGDETEDIVGLLEEGLKAISTLPLRTVLDPLQRTVRDLSRRSAKEARLSVVGAELSLDCRLLESIRGPLVHLIRNAVDHGIETPEARRLRGKHREGSIVIRVEQRGNIIFIEVEDDGNGLEDQRIREEVVRRGLLPAAKVSALSVDDLRQMIFHPGFTTRREVSATSGRGVGLDVVQRQVNALNGQLEVHSKTGQGTRFVLAVAAELGSSPVLMVRCAEQYFGVPLLSVDSLLTMQQSLVRVGRNKVQLEHHDQILQITDLGMLLGLRAPGGIEEGRPLMVIKANGRQLALAVDEVVGDRDLVIRPLPAEVRDVAAYQGAAILAQGQLMLVVRSEWITDPDRLMATVASIGHRALVVDDSLTARALHRAALESGGFVVHTASNGAQALEQLAAGGYDVVICDVLMAGMDGLAFTQKLRTRAETRNLPVVLVSVRDSDTDRLRGLAAGADAFLSKKECASGRLLAEVSAVMNRRRAG